MCIWGGRKTTISKRWRWRGALALSLAFSAAIFSITPFGAYLDRLGGDFLLAAHHAITPSREIEPSPIVIVAIDEHTHRTPPFAETPEVAWTPFLATLLDRIGEFEPAVVGVDLVYPKSLDSPDLLRGYDRPLLKAFRRLSMENKLVLGEAQLGDTPISPYRGQVIAAGGASALASLDFILDRDNVVRRYAPFFNRTTGDTTPTFAAAIASRVGASVPDANFQIRFRGGVSTFPIYSFADLYDCDRADFFEKFRDKIVLIGEVLDIEDRHVATQRLTNGAQQWGVTDTCASGAVAPSRGPNRSSEPRRRDPCGGPGDNLNWRTAPAHCAAP